MFYKRIGKRILDIVLILPFLPLVCLMGGMVAVFIFLLDRGPVFYIAKRAGKNGVPFQMYKFRTMLVDAPDIRNSDGSTYNAPDDFRVTRIGRFLRKCSLDELPQLWNVVRGDMSLVGPRPTLANRSYSTYGDLEKKRCSVLPGLTGYSQAFFRNAISQQEKFRYDCFYVDHLSFGLDVKIIIKTVVSVLKMKNINGKN